MSRLGRSDRPRNPGISLDLASTAQAPSIANVAKELAAPDGGPVEKRNEDRDEKDLG